RALRATRPGPAGTGAAGAHPHAGRPGQSPAAGRTGHARARCSPVGGLPIARDWTDIGWEVHRRTPAGGRNPKGAGGEVMGMDDGLVRVGILGCGNVGTELVRALEDDAALITQRSGVRIEVARVAVHNLAKERDVEFAPGVLTNDADAVVGDP